MSTLIVESSKTDKDIIEKTLTTAGYTQLTFVSSNDECFERLRITNTHVSGMYGLDYELIILGGDTADDVLEQCRRIKQSFHYHDVPVLVISTGSVADHAPMAIAYGAFDYMRKPFVEFEFLARVRAALRLKHEIDRRKARERELIEATRQLSDLNAMLTRLSLIDGLTGVANRRNFDRVLDKEWRRASRSKHEISLLMIDIDYFKAYNDLYGHQSGDECLRQVADILRDALRRPGDMLCRYGGEEFGVILPETGLEGANKVGENLRQTVNDAKISHRGSKVGEFVTLSVGVASLMPTGTINFKQLIENADKALYQAKAAGRNRVTPFHDKSVKQSA
ncbi:MAG: diguanylate cyclase [Deltaproteobacteria bacterium]|nr:diguanylate cyclase [Deltaproteobacteria bacterium]